MPIPQSKSWTLFQKLLFRLVASYVFLFCMSSQFIFSSFAEMLWEQLVPPFAKYILGMEQDLIALANGSGDTTYSYVSLLCYLTVALLMTLIWSVLDRKRPHYEQALQWLIVLVRYYLFFQMALYGLAKIFYLQFQPPRFARLIQAYGDSSPMGLLWTFMGYSKGYTMFTGFGEFLGGLLLLFRRTRTLGALLVFGIMFNVMMLNFCYDVPVKILSTHLVLLAMGLITLDGRRLWNVLVANRPTEALPLPPHFSHPRVEKVKNGIKWLALSIGLAAFVYFTYQRLGQFGPQRSKPALYGLYEVEQFSRNGELVPPLTTDSSRWEWMIVEWGKRIDIHAMDGQRSRFESELDSTAQWLAFTPSDDEQITDTLYYSRPDSGQFALQGVWQTDTLDIRMRIKKKEDFLLMQRPFSWINESPFNR
ncbi:MAG: hypothetical protein AAFV25_10670 [Bacteroidota bacterium]